MARPNIKYIEGQRINGLTYVREVSTDRWTARRAIFICPECENEWETTIAMVKRSTKKCAKCRIEDSRDKVTCPHCGKEGGKLGMESRHFGNCKLK